MQLWRLNCTTALLAWSFPPSIYQARPTLLQIGASELKQQKFGRRMIDVEHYRPMASPHYSASSETSAVVLGGVMPKKTKNAMIDFSMSRDVNWLARGKRLSFPTTPIKDQGKMERHEGLVSFERLPHPDSTALK